MPRRLSVALVLALWATPLTGVARPVADTTTAGHSFDLSAPVLDDVEGAFARIQTRGRHLTARTGGFFPSPSYRTTPRNWFGFHNHFQGIQKLAHGDYIVISGSDRDAADLFVARLPSGEDGNDEGEIIARVEPESAMSHAGGLSLLGTVLAVPVYSNSPTRAKILFYDLGNPREPRKLAVEIDRPDQKATATAFTRLPSGRFLVAVLSGHDGRPRRVDFYLSRSEALDDGFVPEALSWRVSNVRAAAGQEKTFSHFQNINFVRQADGRLYLAGFHNGSAPPTWLPGRDYADLYEVGFAEESVNAIPRARPAPVVTKVGNLRLHCTDGYCNLDAAAGLFVDPDSQSMSIYATPGWLDGDRVKMTVYTGSGSRRPDFDRR